MFATRSYRNLLEAEKLLMDDIKDQETKPHVRALLVTALDRLLERKRIMRMRPKPKDVEVSIKRKRVQAPGQAVLLELAPITEDSALHQHTVPQGQQTEQESQAPGTTAPQG